MKKTSFLILFPILIIVNIFKACKLTVMPLWHDESFSALLIQYDLKEMLYRISLDVHPPLYYLLLKGWGFIFDGSLFSIRMFSVFFGVLTVFAVYLLVKKIFQSEKLALFSSILLALSSFQIQYDMEARMYTLGAFLLVISTYLLIRGIESKKWQWWLLYAVAASAALYTHYYAFFWIFAQGIFMIYWLIKEFRFKFFEWLKEKNFKLFLGAYFLVALSYLPWLNIFLQQLKQVQQTYWIPPMNIWSLPNTFLSMTTGTSTEPEKLWYVLLILMVVIFMAIIYFLKKLKNHFKWLIFFLIAVPFLLSIFLSLKTSIYLDRYFIFTLPFYLIFLAATILLINNKKIRHSLVIMIILGTLISFPVRWAFFEIEKKPGITAAAELLNEEVKTDEKIFVGSSFVYFTFKYYNKTGVRPLLYAPDQLPHFSGTALLLPEDTFDNFEEETRKGDIVWIINTSGFGDYQPKLPENWSKKEEKGFQDTYDYRGWIIVTKYEVN